MGEWNRVERADQRRGRASRLTVRSPCDSFQDRVQAKLIVVERDDWTASFLAAVEVWRASRPLVVYSYGIGPIHTSAVSQYQYALMLALRRETACCTLGCYDPVLDAEERASLARDSIACISFPFSRIEHTLGNCLFFYMPHCEGQTYRELLDDLLGTDVREFLLYGSLVAHEGFHVRRVGLPVEFGLRRDVFNDCHLQVLTRTTDR